MTKQDLSRISKLFQEKVLWIEIPLSCVSEHYIKAVMNETVDSQ